MSVRPSLLYRFQRSASATGRGLLISIALCVLAWQGLAALESTALHRQLIARFGETRVALLNDWMSEIET